MTNRRKKENKFNINNILENKMYSVLGIVLLFILILVISLNVSNKEEEIQSSEINKETFLELKEDIELKVANLMLDGTVVDESSMLEKIEDINSLLEDEKWDKLEINCKEDFYGIWSLDEKGMLKFRFDSKEIEPSWVNDQDIKEYIIKN